MPIAEIVNTEEILRDNQDAKRKLEEMNRELNKMDETLNEMKDDVLELHTLDNVSDSENNMLLGQFHNNAHI